MADYARPLTVAPVGGFSALVCHRLLAARLEQVTAGVHPEYAAQVRATLAALDQAAQAWVVWRRQVAEIEAQAAADGNAAAAGAAARAQSAEVDTATAATRLGVTPRRVRQLIECGRLAGRHMGRQWLVEASALGAYAEGRDGRI